MSLFTYHDYIDQGTLLNNQYINMLTALCPMHAAYYCIYHVTSNTVVRRKRYSTKEARTIADVLSTIWLIKTLLYKLHMQLFAARCLIQCYDCIIKVTLGLNCN